MSVCAEVGAPAEGIDGPWCLDRTVSTGDCDVFEPALPRRAWSAMNATNG